MNFGVNIIPKANNTYTLGNSDYKWNIFANSLNGVSLTNIVTDIQIDSSSIISNNVATIPIASTSTLGVIKVGIGLSITNGVLSPSSATTTQVKQGSSAYVPIVPSNQHESVFYGLAKAAGDSTQASSSNAVGTYTAGAKSAIQSMLDIPMTADDMPMSSSDATTAKAAIDSLNNNLNKLSTPVAFSGDCNTISETCIVYVTDSATNSPGAWYIVMTIAFNEEAKVQFAFHIGSNSIKIRNKGTTWSSWQSVTLA